MKLRDKKYTDYGLTQEEGKALEKRCQELTPEEQVMLTEAAKMTSKEFAEALVKSLREGLSYDKITKIAPIFCSPVDFYAYRRKCVATFGKLLETKGVYNFSRCIR